MAPELSVQQKAVMKFVRRGDGNGIINGVAGCGKSFTLLEAIKRTKGDCVLAVYNKAMQTEIEGRNTAYNAEVKTFHSIGFQALRREFPRIKVDDNKSFKVQQQLQIPKLHIPFVRRLVAIGKNNLIKIRDDSAWLDAVDHFGLDLEFDLHPIHQKEELDKSIKLGVDLTKQAMRRHIAMLEESGSIDFDDMMYLPLHEKVPFQKYDWVFIDEAQDMTLARRRIASQMLLEDSRVLIVGDNSQSLYGWLGASSDAMEKAKSRFDAQDMHLTVSYRCAKSIIALAQTWVPHIEARPGAPEGIVRTISHEQAFNSPRSDFRSTDVILCRVNRPLISLAYLLIRAGVACHVEGREIGKGLTKLIERFKDAATVSQLLDQLAEYGKTRIGHLLSQGKEEAAANIIDQVESIKVVAEAVPLNAGISMLVYEISKLFQDGGNTLTLSSIHKFKGREADRVFWYGADAYQPSRYATKPWQIQQESNLMYVATTRAITELCQITAKKTTTNLQTNLIPQ